MTKSLLQRIICLGVLAMFGTGSVMAERVAEQTDKSLLMPYHQEQGNSSKWYFELAQDDTLVPNVHFAASVLSYTPEVPTYMPRGFRLTQTKIARNDVLQLVYQYVIPDGDMPMQRPLAPGESGDQSIIYRTAYSPDAIRDGIDYGNNRYEEWNDTVQGYNVRYRGLYSESKGTDDIEMVTWYHDDRAYLLFFMTPVSRMEADAIIKHVGDIKTIAEDNYDLLGAPGPRELMPKAQ